jgi:predicted phosphoadenosine phosphosulfate sulfurtransferase
MAIRRYIKTWEARGYKNGIPDEAPAELESNGLVPSYRRICRALLKNDLLLISLGFVKPNCALYCELKRIELGIIRKDIQLSLFGGRDERMGSNTVKNENNI